MYYQPGEATAYESIRFLTTKVPFGWLDPFCAQLERTPDDHFIGLHMFSTMMLKAYRPPPRNYLGFRILLCPPNHGVFGFSGYLLPWNKLAYFATTVGTNIVRSIPLLGDWLLQVLRGGQDVTINTLYRFFAAML
jgi:quinol-cytochrome oxidoreductase complex cytochrome b subunit